MKISKKTAGTLAIVGLMGLVGGFASSAYNGARVVSTTLQNPAQIRLNDFDGGMEELESKILLYCADLSHIDEYSDEFTLDSESEQCKRDLQDFFYFSALKKELEESEEYASFLDEIKSLHKYQGIGLGLFGISFAVAYFSFSAYMSKKREEDSKKTKQEEENNYPKPNIKKSLLK